MNQCFTKFSQKILEADFAFFIAVGHEEDTIVGELAGETGEFVELLGGDFVAAEADEQRLIWRHTIQVIFLSPQGHELLGKVLRLKKNERVLQNATSVVSPQDVLRGTAADHRPITRPR